MIELKIHAHFPTPSPRNLIATIIEISQAALITTALDLSRGILFSGTFDRGIQLGNIQLLSPLIVSQYVNCCRTKLLPFHKKSPFPDYTSIPPIMVPRKRAKLGPKKRIYLNFFETACTGKFLKDPTLSHN